ncbi:RNA polymerase II-associated protein 3 [Contarinia nasturtii]|uniref:RNA polymerase II-associated protein 3 n=1 Tax=Contarinia nasturtii TaxID=265458 RepID=UPI0012D4911A|nr:RNA polymerase II-associated protein 3 [Contarinia nasturtii]
MSDLETQVQAMQKVNQIRDAVNSLYAWEKDVKEQDAKRNTAPDEEAFDQSYMIRSQKPPASDVEPSTSDQATSTKKSNEIPDHSQFNYYKPKSVKPTSSGGETEKNPLNDSKASTSAAQTEAPRKGQLNHINKSNAEKADEFKQRGNDHVKTGEYQKAIHYYTEAIRLNGSEAVFYTNRALCYLKRNEFTECIQDCTKAIELDNLAVKAYYRRAQAYEQMKGDLQVAINDYKCILLIDPKNAEAKRSLSRLDGISKGSKNIVTQRDLKVESVAKKIAWTSQFDGKDGFESIDFVTKPPHLRSNQPLKSITIVDSNEKTTSAPAMIDSNRIVESTSESNIDQTSQKNNKSIANTKKSKSNKMPVIEKIPHIIPVDLVIPKNSAQFYKTWSSIKDDAQKFTVLKGIYNADIGRILGAQFTLNILREIFTILKSEFVHQNLPIVNIMHGIFKNDQMTIISAMMNAEDKLAFTKLMEYMRNRGEDARKINAIEKQFDLLISM